MIAPGAIAAAYRASCLDELDALKPGNVHAFADGHRMAVADFVASAEISAPHLAEAGAPVGRRVLRAVEATIDQVGQNTNLGILLLCAPPRPRGRGRPSAPRRPRCSARRFRRRGCARRLCRYPPC